MNDERYVCQCMDFTRLREKAKTDWKRPTNLKHSQMLVVEVEQDFVPALVLLLDLLVFQVTPSSTSQHHDHKNKAVERKAHLAAIHP